MKQKFKRHKKITIKLFTKIKRFFLYNTQIEENSHSHTHTLTPVSKIISKKKSKQTHTLTVTVCFRYALLINNVEKKVDYFTPSSQSCNIFFIIFFFFFLLVRVYNIQTFQICIKIKKNFQLITLSN